MKVVLCECILHGFQTMGGVFSGKEQDATRGVYAFAGVYCVCVRERERIICNGVFSPSWNFIVCVWSS